MPISRHLDKEEVLGFPGGSVVKTPRARAGCDPWSRNVPHAKKQLSPCVRTAEPVL